jgi:class 3 adenylate cyclase
LVTHERVCGELLIFDTNQQFATHRVGSDATTERFAGIVARYLGDGVMAYFGWPQAHDNDGERSARAGLAILDAISKLNEHLTHPTLAARVGIDSGFGTGKRKN